MKYKATNENDSEILEMKQISVNNKLTKEKEKRNLPVIMKPIRKSEISDENVTIIHKRNMFKGHKMGIHN